MKYVKLFEGFFHSEDLLNEALGVPDNIVDSAFKLYGVIIEEAEKYKKKSDSKEIIINQGFKVGDLIFKRVAITFNFIEFPIEKMTFIRLGVSREDVLHRNKFFKSISTPDLINMIVDIAVPTSWKPKDFHLFLIKEKKELVETLSHELMHAYDNVKRKFRKIQDVTDYNAISRLRFGIEPIDLFMHNLYFITAAENIVRPSEFSASLKLNDVKRKDFLNFLKSSDVYKKLEEIKKFSYDKMRSDLLNSIPEIDNFLEKAGLESPDPSDQGKVDFVLELLYINLTNFKGEEFRNALANNLLELMFLPEEKDKIFNSFIRKIRSFGDFENFVRYEEKNFREVADKMIRKISKLYASLDEKKSQIGSSIIDWDLYHEVNKTRDKFIEYIKKRK